MSMAFILSIACSTIYPMDGRDPSQEEFEDVS